MINAPSVVTKMYDFLLYLIPQTAKFPRTQRYLLGERLEEMGLEVLELLLEASYSRDKGPLLRRANVTLEKGRYLARLCKDLKLIDFHRYEVISKMTNEVGVQLGGWIKQQKT